MDLYKLLRMIKDIETVVEDAIEIKKENMKVIKDEPEEQDEPGEIKEPVSIMPEINSVVRSLGLKAHIKGYEYIKLAVFMIIEDKTIMHKITARLYPKIAETFNTRASRVERAIRHSIEILWQSGEFTAINKLFGREVNLCEKKPTNSEFLATLADYISIRQEKNGR